MEKDDRYTRITLRIPKDLHERLSACAEETSKSMNAEIIARLEGSFEPHTIFDAEPLSFHTTEGKEVRLTPEKLLSAAGHHIERAAFAATQLEQLHVKLAMLEDKRRFNSLRRLMEPEKEDDISLQQMQITSEIASLNTQIFMLESEIRQAENILGYRVEIPGVKGFDPAKE